MRRTEGLVGLASVLVALRFVRVGGSPTLPMLLAGLRLVAARAPGAPAPPMAYAHPRFTRDADAAALSSVTRAASPKSSPPSSPKAAAPGSPEAPTSPRRRPREANEESALTALFALSGVSSSVGGDAAPVEPKRQMVDEPVRVVG